MERNYTYTIGTDTITEGISITKSLTINGNGFTINAQGKSRIFNIGTDANVVLNNITFINGYTQGNGEVAICNFDDNDAVYAGAVYFSSTGNIAVCNFTDNSASSYGGAVHFEGECIVANCNFTNNAVSGNGGAIRISSGTVTNCNFTNNTASNYGGAVFFYIGGKVSNCIFDDNDAYYGGAVYFMNGDGEVANCNFTDNNATANGGAVFFNDDANVTNCNFTGNNAVAGSAIYFYSTSATKTLSNSRFLNNRANAEALEVTKNDNNITITFIGNDNLLNAIYSRNDAEVAFTNVTYWGANGITTVSATLSGSNREAGQNITVDVVVNDELVLNEVKSHR